MDEDFNNQDGTVEVETQIITSSSALESLERAQVDMQVTTAKKWPRSLVKVKQAMLAMATLDEESAASCFYTLPRGGKAIQGPSVRMAEIAASCFGNLQSGARCVGVDMNDPKNATVTCQGVAWDMETNSRFTLEVTRRITKKKSKDRPDPDDIQLATAACAAIAWRGAMFKVVPMSLIKPVTNAAKAVAIGTASTLVQKREAYVRKLVKMGAKEANIFLMLGVKKLEEITLDHLETLAGVGTAIREGQTSVADAFPDPVAEEASPKLPPKETKPEKTEAVEAKPETKEEVKETPKPQDEIPGLETKKKPEPVKQAKSPESAFWKVWEGSGMAVADFFPWLKEFDLNPKGYTVIGQFSPEELEAIVKLLPKAK